MRELMMRDLRGASNYFRPGALILVSSNTRKKVLVLKKFSKPVFSKTFVQLPH